MADNDGEKCDPEENLLQRQRKERKELQGELQKLKHSVTKGDKKKKKETTEKIALLEAELDAKHEKELAELKETANSAATANVAEVNAVQKSIEVLTTDDVEDVAEPAVKQKKQTKAQKRRDKKAAQDQEREDRIREQEIENLTSSRHLEAVKIGAILAQRSLQIHEIPSDGNCLYAAVSHQLAERKVLGIEGSTNSLRTQVADYMREHPEDFLPFLTKENGDCYTQDDFAEYCKLLETTPAWGGQLEIQALCNVLHIPVEVVQAEGPSLVTGENYDSKPLVLTYYRHAYGLGEHYHSVEQKVENPDDEFT